MHGFKAMQNAFRKPGQTFGCRMQFRWAGTQHDRAHQKSDCKTGGSEIRLSGNPMRTIERVMHCQASYMNINRTPSWYLVEDKTLTDFPSAFRPEIIAKQCLSLW